MALLAATTARRASALLRPVAARFASMSDDVAESALRRAKTGVHTDSSGTLRHTAEHYRSVAASLSAKAAALRAAAADDGGIVRAIDSVIQSHDRGLQVVELPSDFPFKITKDGLNGITLTRSLNGEQIEVLVSMPTLDQDDEDEEEESDYAWTSDAYDEFSPSDDFSSSSDDPSSSTHESSSSSNESSSSSHESSSSSDEYSSSSHEHSASSDENQEDKSGNGPEEYTVPLTVTVSKADGSSLEFSCTAYHDSFFIDTLSMKQPPLGDEEDQDVIASEYEDVDDLITSDEVVEFSELDEKQQHELYKYLEQRGITPVNTKILHEHMISRHQHRRRGWLAKLWDFVKKE